MKDPFLTKDSGGTIIRKPCPQAINYLSEEFLQLATKRIEEHNSPEYKSFSGVAIFPNYQSAFLFLEEFLGQISDGKYENSNIDWQWYGQLKVMVDPMTGPVLNGFGQDRSLRFTDLLWLFDSGNLEASLSQKEREDVRLIFSNCPTKELWQYVRQVALAINRKKEVYA